MAKNPADVRAKWQSSASGSQERYTQGVQQTDVDVMGRAVAAKGIAAQRFAQAMSDGSYERGVQASGGTAGWKSAVAKKAANYGTGIAAGADKFERSMSKLLPALDGITRSLPARVPGDVMGNVTRRVGGIAQALHSQKGQFKG